MIDECIDCEQEKEVDQFLQCADCKTPANCGRCGDKINFRADKYPYLCLLCLIHEKFGDYDTDYVIEQLELLDNGWATLVKCHKYVEKVTLGNDTQDDAIEMHNLLAPLTGYEPAS